MPFARLGFSGPRLLRAPFRALTLRAFAPFSRLYPYPYPAPIAIASPRPFSALDSPG